MIEQRLHMDEVFKVDGYGIVIHFSDGTMSQYTVEELSKLRPNREKTVPIEPVQDLTKP